MPEIVSRLEAYHRQRLESQAEAQREKMERKKTLKQQQELERQLEKEIRDRKKELEREMSEKLASLKRDKKKLIASVPVAAAESIEIPQVVEAPPPSLEEPFLNPEPLIRPKFFIGHSSQPLTLEISSELAKRRQARLKAEME